MSEHLKVLENELKGRISADFLREQAENISEIDIRKVLSIVPAIMDKIKAASPMRKYQGDVRLMLDMLAVAQSGKYPVSQECQNQMTYALLYFYTPGDIIPDYVPGTGYLDDIAVFSRCLELIKDELKSYSDFCSDRQ